MCVLMARSTACSDIPILKLASSWSTRGFGPVHGAGGVTSGGWVGWAVGAAKAGRVATKLAATIASVRIGPL